MSCLLPQSPQILAMIQDSDSQCLSLWSPNAEALSCTSTSSQNSLSQLKFWLTSQTVTPTSKGGLGDSQTSASSFMSLIKSWSLPANLTSSLG